MTYKHISIQHTCRGNPKVYPANPLALLSQLAPYGMGLRIRSRTRLPFNKSSLRSSERETGRFPTSSVTHDPLKSSPLLNSVLFLPGVTPEGINNYAIHSVARISWVTLPDLLQNYQLHKQHWSLQSAVFSQIF